MVLWCLASPEGQQRKPCRQQPWHHYQTNSTTEGQEAKSTNTSITYAATEGTEAFDGGKSKFIKEFVDLISETGLKITDLTRKTAPRGGYPP